MDKVDDNSVALIRQAFEVLSDPKRRAAYDATLTTQREKAAAQLQAQSPDLVAKGEVELGIAQASEIVPIAGTQLVGPLPGELGSMTLFAGAVGAETQSADAAKALIDFLSGPEAAPHFKSKGFQTGL